MDELTQAETHAQEAHDAYTAARANVLATMKAERRYRMTQTEYRSLNALHKVSHARYQAYWQARTKVERHAN